MRYLYKNASYEAVNRVNYYRSIIKQANFNDFMSSLGEYKNPLIGAGIGMGLGYLLSPENKKLLGTLGGGVLGGLGGWGFGKWFGKGNEDNSLPSDNTYGNTIQDNDDTPLKIGGFNNDGSYTLVTNGSGVQIPAKDMYNIGIISNDIYAEPDKYFYIPNPEDGKSKPFMIRDDIELEPTKRLSLIHGGWMNPTLPKDFAFPDDSTKQLFQGDLPLYYISQGLKSPTQIERSRNRPAMSYYFSPYVLTPERYNALQEYLSKNGMTVWDIGNIYSDKWNKNWKGFQEIYRGAPIGLGN